MAEQSQDGRLRDWPVSQEMLDAGLDAWRESFRAGATPEQILQEVYLTMAVIATIEEVYAESENAA